MAQDLRTGIKELRRENQEEWQISRRRLLKLMGAESERGQQGGQGGVVSSPCPGDSDQGSALGAAGKPPRSAMPMFRRYLSAGLRSWAPITITDDLQSPPRWQVFTCKWDRQPPHLAYIDNSVEIEKPWGVTAIVVEVKDVLLPEVADLMSARPVAPQLRYLQTMGEMASERSSTTYPHGCDHDADRR